MSVPPVPRTGRAGRLSLGTWLMVAMLFATVLAVLSCALLIENFARAHAERRAIESLRQISADFRDALDRGMAQQYQEIRVLAQLEPFRRLDDPARVRAALDQVQLGFNHFAWIGLTDADGKVLAAASGLLEGVNVSKRPWWQGALGGPFVGDVHGAVLLEKLLPRQAEPWRFVDIAVPLRDSRGELQGVLGAHLSWTWARRIKAELIDMALEVHGADAFVIGKDGSVLLGPADTEGKPLAGMSVAVLATPEAAQLTEVDGQPFFVVMAATRGHDAYPGLGWTVMMRKPQAVALADYFQLRRQIATTALILLTLCVPLAWLLSRRLTAPLVQLAGAIAARHHLGEARMPRVGGYREAALLSNALAELADRQAEQDASLERRVAERTAELNQAMQRLEASELRLRAVTDHMPAMVGYFNREQLCEFSNEMGLRVHDLKASALQGLSLRKAIGEASYLQHAPHVERALAGTPGRFDGELHYKGEQVFFQSHLVPDRDPQGGVQGFYLMTFDITPLKQAELSAARSESRLRTIADNLPVLISYIDAERRLRFLNATYRDWMGVDPADALGLTLQEAVGDTLYAPRRDALDRALAGERVSFETVSETAGVSRHLQTDYIPDRQPDGTIAGIYTLSADVTTAKQVERQLDEMSKVDPLTGCPNRRQFEERLPQAMARCRRTQQTLGLLFLDVDRFKGINDSLGHAAGDAVLKEFARRVGACVRSSDMAARLGGDEFVLILEGLPGQPEAERVAAKILAAITEPFLVAGQPLQVSTSIGLACYDGSDASEIALLGRADEALYAAKSAGRGTYRVAPPPAATGA